MFNGALSNIKVLDLTHGVAGPFCTKLLADYGAGVIKIEKPAKGDICRYWPPHFQDDLHPEKSGLFLYLNTNKKSITLNLKTEVGKEIFFRLLEEADILVENFRPGVMADMKLDYGTLEKQKPSLVMTSLSNFGQKGPYRDFKAQDITAFALGGVLYTCGDPDKEPVKFAGPQSQLMLGLVGSVATMGALFHSKRTGLGQQVDVSMMEAVLSILELVIMRYPYSGYQEERYGSVFGFYPWGVYACKDGYISLCVNNRQWKRVGEWLGRPELANNPAYSTPADRFKHQDELEAIIAPYCLEHTKEEIVTGAQKYGIPTMGVYNAHDMLRNEHYKAREFFVKIKHPIIGELTYPGAPFKMSRTPSGTPAPAPLLGEHNEEIYCNKLKYSKEALVDLAKSGVV